MSLRILILVGFISLTTAASFKLSKLPFLQHGMRKRTQLPSEDKDEWRKITDCVQPVYDSGRYIYRSSGQDPMTAQACGLYVITSPDKVIQVEFEVVDVSCGSGLVAFFDGWEMNGKIFPSESDHELPLKQRITEFCGEEIRQDFKFRSSQNAALVQYKIPKAGDGFAVKVSILDNPKPCNILMSEMSGLFTLTNYGSENRNCTLTTMLFPATFQITDFKVGQTSRSFAKKRMFLNDNTESCSKDFLEIGGSSDLETSELETKEDVCTWPMTKSVTVLCGSSTVRLVSSGHFANSLTIVARAADESDLMNSNNAILACPEFA